MKKLIYASKEADFELSLMEQWVSGDHRGVTATQMEALIANNHDCLWAGDLYRVLHFRSAPEDEIDARRQIKTGPAETRHYQSFTKSQKFIKTVIVDDIDDEDYPVVIHCKTRGLDVNKFLAKHDTGDGYNPFPEQQEVIAKLPSQFDVIQW